MVGDSITVRHEEKAALGLAGVLDGWQDQAD